MTIQTQMKFIHVKSIRKPASKSKQGIQPTVPALQARKAPAEPSPRDGVRQKRSSTSHPDICFHNSQLVQIKHNSVRIASLARTDRVDRVVVIAWNHSNICIYAATNSEGSTLLVLN